MVKKSTHWVTIPEETLHTPVSEVSSAKKDRMSGKSKMFWGASFIVLIVLTAALVAPKELASLLQGNLFEQSGIEPLNVIPTATTETVATSEETAETPAVTETAPDTLVEATTEATAIQIEPVVTTVEPTTTTTTGTTTTTTTTTGTEVTGELKDELDANKKLLEELSKQVAEFKEKDKAKTEVIEDLTNIVQEQGIHTSAPEATTPAVTATTTLGQTVGGYRVNTHTVKTTPYQVLQMNTNQLNSQQAYLGQTTQQIYRSQLSQAEGTPDSGPREALIITLMLSFVAVLGWKFGKLARA